MEEAASVDCLESEANRVQVQENMNRAQADAVSTLPAVPVGDSKIEGRQPLDTYTQAIETALATKPA